MVPTCGTRPDVKFPRWGHTGSLKYHLTENHGPKSLPSRAPRPPGARNLPSEALRPLGTAKDKGPFGTGPGTNITNVELKQSGASQVRLSSCHLALGLPNPCYHIPKVAMALLGLECRYGQRERRHLATVRMVAWLKAKLEPHKSADFSVLWARLCLGFFFLPRASDYLKIAGPNK